MEANSKSKQQICIRSEDWRIAVMLLLALCLLSGAVLFSICAFVREDLFSKIFSALVALAAIFCCFKLTEYGLKNYLVLNIFDANGIECRRFGRLLKHLHWRDIKEVICVEFVRYRRGITTKYIMFSEHPLTDDEKKRSIDLAGDRNDIAVIKYNKISVDKISYLTGRKIV